MLLSAEAFYWSNILNLIIHQYLNETTTCILWHKEFDMDLHLANHTVSYSSTVIIEPSSLHADLASDFYSFEEKRLELHDRGVLVVDDLTVKLIASIESSHCESFIVFQQDIPQFVTAFIRASLCSIWRSIRNKFIFVYTPALEADWQLKYFSHRFFEDQPDILLIEGVDGLNSSQFLLKTNKYTGPRIQKPSTLIMIGTYDAISDCLLLKSNLFADKTYDLKGREVVISTFEYRPDNTSKPNTRDLGYGEEGAPVFVDGTEIRIILEFCIKHNCTLLIDTTETDWGTIYENLTADGALSLVLDGRSDVTLGAMYLWHSAYVYLDVSIYSGRSGITCVVPAPQRLTSWVLPLEPFQLMLWVGVLLGLGVEMLFLVFLRRWQCLTIEEESEKASWLHSVRYGCSTTFRIFISQSSNQRYAISTALRVLLFACFMNDIIITSIYSGGLSSILTIPSFEEAADSLQRLRKHRLHWAATSEAWISSLRGTNDTTMNEILANFKAYDSAQMRVLAKTKYMGFTVERLLFGHYALEDHLTTEVLKKFKIMVDDIYFQYTVSFVQRLWPLLERYNTIMNVWHATGLDKYWEWRSVADYLDPQVQKQVEASLYYTHVDASLGPTRLGMANFAGIILVWCLGIIIATIAFCIELICRRCQI